MACRHQLQRGFTLVEITIVMVIAAIMLTMGISAFTAAMENAAHSATSKRLELIKESLSAYLARNRRLPCPDLPGAAGNLAGSGDDNRTTPGDLNTTCSAAVGVVPYSDLGLSRDAVIDGWDNFISYAVTASATATSDWTRSGSFYPGKLGNLTVALRDPATSATTTLLTGAENAVLVLVSHGPNGFGAWTIQGTQNAAPVAGSDEATNASGGTAFIQREPTTNTALVAGAFDDKVAFMKASELVAPLIRDGAVRSSEGETRKVLADTSDALIGASIATATLPISYTMPMDGWGVPLIYNRLVSSQITTVTANTTAFTIHSAGPNRTNDSGTGDDVVFSVSVDNLKSVFARSGTLVPPVVAP